MDTSNFHGRFFLTSHQQIDEEILGSVGREDGGLQGGEPNEEEEEEVFMSIADAHKLGVVL